MEEENRPLDKATLMAMLATSKRIMDKVESTGYKKTGGLSDNDYQPAPAHQESIAENYNYPTQDDDYKDDEYGDDRRFNPSPDDYDEKNFDSTAYARNNPNGIAQTHKNLRTSKMDPRILEAMINNPIVPESMSSTFSLEDMQSNGHHKPNISEAIRQPNRQPMNNKPYNGEKMITMTESELDAKIKSALLEFMTTTFTKALTETTIKKTIGTLIREGKIKVREKK